MISRVCFQPGMGDGAEQGQPVFPAIGGGAADATSVRAASLPPEPARARAENSAGL